MQRQVPVEAPVVPKARLRTCTANTHLAPQVLQSVKLKRHFWRFNRTSAMELANREQVESRTRPEIPAIFVLGTCWAKAVRLLGVLAFARPL